ncbi:MAG: hemophore, partial [Mycobacterium sp.]
MKLSLGGTTPTVPRALCGVLAACLSGGVAAAVVTGPSATAANDPCAASEIARTIGTVATNTGAYLDSHSATNAALTAAAQQQGPQALAAVNTYFDANPQAGKDLQAIQQPLTGLSGRCRLPITMPQLLQMVQGAQNSLAPSVNPQTVPTPAGPRPGPAGNSAV